MNAARSRKQFYSIWDYIQVQKPLYVSIEEQNWFKFASKLHTKENGNKEM